MRKKIIFLGDSITRHYFNDVCSLLNENEVAYYDNKIRKLANGEQFNLGGIYNAKEISDIVEAQYQRAIALLNENKDKLIELAEVLLKEEVIFKDNLETIFGKRPYETSKVETEVEKTEEEE